MRRIQGELIGRGAKRKRDAKLLSRRRKNKEKGYFTGEMKIGYTPRQTRKYWNLRKKHAA